ncbi:YitT family protein [[Mycoplasma] gypis]|uniref:YitT family protein n=1 Tax=[Mycoplasma] gypis TaxID=92404 RepID=A0ABZ2RP54_9BACT|nr:YitT family protein [[Mycoplasma] gypis]MBN0919102.1 YitT family protein [[Mycoplasma] gypis]
MNNRILPEKVKKHKLTKEQKEALKENKQKAKQTWQEEMNPYNVNFINVWRKFPKKLFFIFLSAVFFNLGVATFLSKAAVVATGTSSITQIITFTMNWDRYFGYFYVLVNLPIMIYFWRKNPRLFMVLTAYWLVFQVVTQAFFGEIPQINKFLKETITIYSPKDHNYWVAFNHPLQGKGSYYDGQTWPIFVYAIIGGVLDGFASAIAWKQGACIAGSNVIVYYISKVKKASVGKIGFIVSMLFATFSICVLGTLEIFQKIPTRPWNYLHDSITDNSTTKMIVRVLCTVIYIGVYSFVIDRMYPKYKKIRIEVYSNKLERISEKLKRIEFNHSWNIYYGISGKTHKDLGRIEISSLFLEKDWIIAQIRSVDPNAWIGVIPMSDVKGKFDTSFID